MVHCRRRRVWPVRDEAEGTTRRLLLIGFTGGNPLISKCPFTTIGRVQPLPFATAPREVGESSCQARKPWRTRQRRRTHGGGGFCFCSSSPWLPYAGLPLRSQQLRRPRPHRPPTERGGRCSASWRRRGTPPTSARPRGPASPASTLRRLGDSLFFCG